MSVPKKRRTRASIGKRRSHHSLSSQKLAKCPKCGKAIQAHRACNFCGYYKGREVIKIKSKAKESKKS